MLITSPSSLKLVLEEFMKNNAIFIKNWNWKPLLFLTPVIIMFGIFVFWPLLYTFYLSFFEWNMVSPTKTFVGLDNYVSILTDSTTYKVLANTGFYILILVIINLIIPYIFAFVLHLILNRFKGFYKSAIFLPAFISLVVGSILFTWILNPVSGPVAEIADWFGISLPIWSQTEGLVIVVISLITSWKVFGYNFIILFASISGISEEVIEAARLDGVPLHRIFLDIILPMSSSSGVYILILTIVQGLQFVYTPISVITQGGPNDASSNLIYQSYDEGFILFRTGHSAALSILTLLLFAILLLVEFKYVERGVHYEN